MTKPYDNGAGDPPYPGEFMPAVKAKDVGREYRKRGRPLGNEPLANITELPDSYRVEIAVPGAKREDLFVRIGKNILTVIALRRSECNEASYHLFEFNHYFERHIRLPGSIEPQFAGAEYKDGVLHVYIPKTDQPLNAAPARIVVY